MTDTMQIIRDDEMYGLAMIPLLVDYDIKRCNVDGCTDRPNTIVLRLAPDIPRSGFCEGHFQQANSEGGVKFDLTFDGFDAFAHHPATAPTSADTDGEEDA